MPHHFPSSHIVSWSIIIMVCIHHTLCGPRYSSRIVATRTGDIRGVIIELNAKHLEPVEAFRGIPYAMAPVGELRYRHTQEFAGWSGTKLADTFGAVCPQKHPDVSNRTAALERMPKERLAFLKRVLPMLAVQSEDCLFMNLYIPGSGNRGLDAPYAVIVYIHGESFEWGSGNLYDGSVLASYGHVIVVTLNYRLGILGFLKTCSANCNNFTSGGNLALWDITQGLRWLKTNIASFGGDASRVTLVGHDTGAAIVNLLLVSSLAKGLFTKVILLGGSILSPWATASNPNEITRSIGEQFNCYRRDSNETHDIAPCLRKIPLKVLLSAHLDSPRFIYRIAPHLPIDRTTSDPLAAMERNSDVFITCDVLVGVSTSESYNDLSAEEIQYGFEEEQRNRILRTFIRNAYVYHLNEIFSAVRNEYTDWDKPIQHPINLRDSTMEALSDGLVAAPLIRVAYLHSRRGAKTYFFHFAYQTKDGEYPQRLGSVRGEDLVYAFGVPLIGGTGVYVQNFTRQDVVMSETLMTYLTNFVKTGDPNEARLGVKVRDRGSKVYWETYDTRNQQYLSLSAKPKLRNHYRGHKLAMWLNLIPQLHQPGDTDVSMRHHHFHEKDLQYYAGTVRQESHTRPPPITNPHNPESRPVSTECNYQINTTLSDQPTENSVLETSLPVDSGALLDQLTSKHYYSYTAALGITVGVGCLLLVLNMLIFAGIYYKRGRGSARHKDDATNASGSTETLPMTRLSSSGELRGSDVSSTNTPNEPPPCYTIVNKNEVRGRELESRESTLRKDGRFKPEVPLRSSVLSSGEKGDNNTIKKRVQIQEISV